MQAACSSITKPKNSSVTLQQNAWVRSGSEKSVEKKKGETIEISNQAVSIEAPGYVGVVLVPTNSNIAKHNINLKPIENWGGEAVESHLNQVVTFALQKIITAQVMLGQGKAKEALELVQEIQREYPNVSYFKFVEASCLAVLGEKEKARSVLSDALKKYPSHPEAQKLFVALGGEPFWQDAKQEKSDTEVE